MKILQFRGKHPNFGDELNTWLWPRLLPGFFDNNVRETFIGIGSTIGDAPEEAATKIVFGSGFVPHYHVWPNLAEGDWRVYFVRGPRTASRLKLDPALAISDSGILARQCVDTSRYNPSVVSFMPHWESMERGNWDQVCAQAGVNLIDPRRPVNKVFDELLRSKLVIAEAMHGAIIADALRIPFVPVVPINPVHRDKWYDWAESLNLKLDPQMIPPSGLQELSSASFNMAPPPVVDISAAHAVSAQPSAEGKESILTRTKRTIGASPLSPWVDSRLIDLSARKLARLATMGGQLSDDRVMEEVTERMIGKLDLLAADYGYTRRTAQFIPLPRAA